MTDLYNDVETLGAVISDLLNEENQSARQKLQRLLKAKGEELAAMEAYYDELAKQYADGVGEGQSA